MPWSVPWEEPTCLWQVEKAMTLQSPRMRGPEGRPPNDIPARKGWDIGRVIPEHRRCGTRLISSHIWDRRARMVPRLRRSRSSSGSVPQPFRAGLTFSGRPSGPWRLEELRCLLYSRRLGRAGAQSRKWSACPGVPWERRRRGTKPGPARACVIGSPVEGPPPASNLHGSVTVVVANRPRLATSPTVSRWSH
jgi:hypothetical protein